VKIYIKSLKCSQDSLSRNELVDLKFEDLEGKGYSIGFILLFSKAFPCDKFLSLTTQKGEIYCVSVKRFLPYNITVYYEIMYIIIKNVIDMQSAASRCLSRPFLTCLNFLIRDVSRVMIKAIETRSKCVFPE